MQQPVAPPVFRSYDDDFDAVLPLISPPIKQTDNLPPLSTHVIPAAPNNGDSVADLIAPNVEPTSVDTSTVEEYDTEPLGCGHRKKLSPTKLSDYVVKTVYLPGPSHSSHESDASSGTLYPLSDFLTCDRFSENHCRFLLILTAAVEPRSFKEVM